MPAGALVTVPEPVPANVTESILGSNAKLAVTVVSVLSVT
jgi:hypothetical protein